MELKDKVVSNSYFFFFFTKENKQLVVSKDKNGSQSSQPCQITLGGSNINFLPLPIKRSTLIV